MIKHIDFKRVQLNLSTSLVWCKHLNLKGNIIQSVYEHSQSLATQNLITPENISS